MSAGRPKNEKSAIKAYEYHTKGLKQTEIAKLMDTSKWQVRRWIFYVKSGKVDKNNIDS